MSVDVNDGRLKSFVAKVAERTGKEASWVSELGCCQLESESWGPFVVKMHHYFFIAHDDAATAADFEAFSQACVEWGLKHYRGLPRGLQKGVAIYPVLLQEQPSSEVVALTKRKSGAHWAAFVLPCAVSLATGAVEYMEKTPVWGFAMWKGVRKAADSALG